MIVFALMIQGYCSNPLSIIKQREGENADTGLLDVKIVLLMVTVLGMTLMYV